MNKPVRALGYIGMALAAFIWLCGAVYIGFVAGAMSGNPAMVPFTIFLAIVPIGIGILILRKHSGNMPAPAFIEKRQNKILLTLLLVYAGLFVIVGLTKGFK